MRYFVIDLETSIKNRGEDAVGSMKASPHHPDNQICYMGLLTDTELLEIHDYLGKTPPEFSGARMDKFQLIVGHNIKFDLLYLFRDFPKFHALLYANGVQIWDTMLAEYILTGQEAKFASLDQLSEKYGGSLKDDTIKEYWDKGVDTEDIPVSEIVPYLESDLKNTDLIFKQQLELATDMDILKLMMCQMEALLATTEMEFEGMRFDKSHCVMLGTKALDHVIIAQNKVEEEMGKHGVPQPNAASVPQVRALIFGGTIKWTEKVPLIGPDGKPLKYKSGAKEGEPRTKLQGMEKELMGLYDGIPSADWETSKGELSVSDSVLEQIVRGTTSLPLQMFIADLQIFRKLQKSYNSYFKTYPSLVWADHRIHANFNHTATATGRLSSSAPNFQNVAGKE